MNLFKWLKPKKRSGLSFVQSSTDEKIQKDWKEITLLVKGEKPSQLRQALITADRTLDTALRDISYGDAMGERLKNAKDKFRDYQVYQGVWDAHKMRNALVHEAGFEQPYFVLKESIEKLKTGLRSMGVAL